ncbi:MAG: hypothetical protein HQL06_14705 [Nitrospirae bacterium]|nr:hypothetical protein [Nitrospirota bacterium]
MIREKITKYLSYLRDISRRITISRYGFERGLIDRNKNDLSYTLQISEDELNNKSYLQTKQAHLGRVYNYIENSYNKSLFCGYGLICGVKNEKTFVAPITFLEYSLEKKDNVSYTIEPDYLTLTLNHDLISKLLTQYNIAEDDEQLNFDDEISIIERAERLLKDCTDKDDLLKKAGDIFKIFKEKIEGFKRIKEFIGNYVYKDELERYQFHDKRSRSKQNSLFESEKSLFEKDLVHVDAIHLFVNQVPDQLSTFKAIDMLINEVKKNDEFKNRTLENLLVNAITDERRELNIQTDHSDETERILNDYLPIPLSKAQIASIISAWTSDISYIQGPPGTGKSYTISAIVLSALYLNKRVLVISQKTPALNVVKEMVEPYLQFANITKIQGIIYYEKEKKKEIREHIIELLNMSNGPLKLKSELENIEKKIKEYEVKIMQINNEISKLNSTLQANLGREQRYNDLHNEFISLRDSFMNYFKDGIIDGYTFNVITNIEDYETNLDKVERIQGSGIKNLATELYISKFRKHILDNFSPNSKYLNNSQLYQFCKELISLHSKYKAALDIRNCLKYDNNLIRNNIKNLKDSIIKYQKELLKLKYRFNVLKHLYDIKNRIEIDKLSRMLWYNNAKIVDMQMQDINYTVALEIMPYWVAEIRHLGHVFPMTPDLFDLVIVDEASQVNIAEAIPAFYRGKSICIVGDHQQLGLDSTGVNFQLSKNYDIITWNKHFQSKPDYQTAKVKKLTVTDASILDFIMSDANNIQRVRQRLDEHFRSMPLLAQYTNKHFYEDTLKIMTETPDKMSVNCFKSIKVDGKRATDKTILAEAERVIKVIRDLTKDQFRDILKKNHEILLPDDIKQPYSIGIISMIRNQCEKIREMLEENIDSKIIEQFDIKVDTPEEYQGHERDIIILSLCLDSTCNRGQGHFQNTRRLNVATSRARKFTILIYSDIPDSFDKICQYERFLNSAEMGMPKFDPTKYESEFEREVYSYLNDYIEKNKPVNDIKIFNQVVSCGQKRLDFVLYNLRTKKAVAVEVDGSHHFRTSGSLRVYTDEHIERMDILKRAGWNIINTPYYLWYNGGWLSNTDNEKFRKEIERIYNALNGHLGITSKQL